MKYPAARLADVALSATVISSVVTGGLLLISELSRFWLRHPLDAPSLWSFMALALILILVNWTFYFRIRQARRLRNSRASWAEWTTGLLTLALTILAYLVVRSRRFSQQEWLPFLYVSVLFAILGPQLIVRLVALLTSGRQQDATAGESMATDSTVQSKSTAAGH